MTIERKNRDQFDPNEGNGGGSFQEHGEHMRVFRRSHTDVAMVNGPRYGETALLESTQSWQVSRTMMETGGSRLLNGTTDWSALVPILKVAQYKLSQN